MSDGWNKQFTQLKSNFLVGRPITVGFNEHEVPAVAGIHDFDIEQRTLGTAQLLAVLGFGHRAKAVTWKSNRISAYWLPWQSQDTVHMDIGDAADYFFTSELNGCQFRVARTAVNTLRIVHVAGDYPGAATAAGSQHRNVQAQARFTPAQYPLSRGLTSTALLGVPVAAHHSVGYGGGSWTNVVGFRHWHVIGAATWEVWVQQVTRPGANFAANAFHLCTL
jgi:hypothetical protein